MVLSILVGSRLRKQEGAKGRREEKVRGERPELDPRVSTDHSSPFAKDGEGVTLGKDARALTRHHSRRLRLTRRVRLDF